MKVKLEEGMLFQRKPGECFTVRKYDFYEDGEPIWCAVCGNNIYPLSEICLDSYMPFVDGMWVNERNEYEY